MPPMSSPSDLSENMPNASLMYTTYTSTFGNILFSIQPSASGEVSNNFGQIPYVSLEGIMYNQQMQSATNQANTTSNQMTGQQNVTGALTVSDSAGNIVAQVSAGSVPATGAASTSQPTS